MSKLNSYPFLLLLFPSILFSQALTLRLMDIINEKPIPEVQVLSDSGSQIGFTDENGLFTFNVNEAKSAGIKELTFYNRKYASRQFLIDKIPSVISLERIYEIEPVVLSGNKKGDYFVLHGYFRSWKLINNKLVKYNDMLIYYYIPYMLKKAIKVNISDYRTLRKDEFKDKGKGFISLGDNYMSYKISKTDGANIYKNNNYFKLEKVNDSTSILYSKNKHDVFIKRGKILYDKDRLIKDVQKSISFEKDEAFRVLLWKATGQYYNLERWTGKGDTRHISYFFNSYKTVIKDNLEETINELFIDGVDTNIADPSVKMNNRINSNNSHFEKPFWIENLKAHPLPLNIQNQIKKLQMTPNNFKG